MSASPNCAADAFADPSERVQCEHAERCGGCPLIALPYAEQLARKERRVADVLGLYPSLGALQTDPVTPARNLVGYRSRAKLMVAPGGQLGLFAQGGGHRVVDIPQCRVLAPSLARVSTHLRARIGAAESLGGALAPFDPSRSSASLHPSGLLRAVDLREVRGEGKPAVLVTFVVAMSPTSDLGPLREAARALMHSLPEVAGVAVNFHVGDSPQVLGGETQLLAGATALPDRIGDSPHAPIHYATFGSFVQTHRDQAARVHALLADAFGLPNALPSGPRAKARPTKPRILDLYGGSGAIALGLADAGASVRLVESFAPAAAQAQAAARAQNLDVEAECADVTAALRALAGRREHFDGAVVNPPRRGTHPATREWLARVGPTQIAYVSCDPDTLARDLDHLRRLGYFATSLRPFDMIPLTDEVEAVAFLQRSRPEEMPVPRVLWENAEAIVVEKAPHEPTMPQGEYTSSLLARARRLAGAAEAVPVHRLDVGTSGVVLLARRVPLVAKWAAVLAASATRRIYLTAVRGVTPAKGTIARPLREEGKAEPACSRYRRIGVASGQSVLRVVVHTERRHQIRRHLAAIGHPVLGDDRYGHAPTNRYFEERKALDRTFLHSLRLEFDDPDTAARHVVEAPLPGDLKAVLARIEGPADRLSAGASQP